MTSKLMTAEQAFNYAMNVYPSLYSSKSLELSKFKYFDHIFNTIGNGYRDTNEFISGHWVNDRNKKYIHNFPEKYITTEPLFMAHTECQMIGNHKMPILSSAIDGLFTEQEIKDMPETYSYMQINTKYEREEAPEFVPYPNFGKTYSMVWKMDMSKLDKSWKKAAIWYYEKAKKFFNSENVHAYHYAFPKEEDKFSKVITEYNSLFEKYRKEGMTNEDFYKAISEAYEMEYDGDTAKFIKYRWQKELNRILDFIDETIAKMKS